jgi:hypothetical protein
MKNWKTTLGGILAATGQYLINHEQGWMNIAGQIVSAIGLLLLGSAASDAKSVK